MLTILYDGIAYGMLLFVLACGLSVTLGLMNFINLAHGAFAMAGGYCTVIVVNRFGIPFALGLPIAFLVTALLGGIFGMGDVAGKYYVPKLGAFVIYAIMIIVLIWRPQGLFARGAVSR